MKGKFFLDKYLVDMSFSCLAQGNYTLCMVQFDLLPCPPGMPLGICSFFLPWWFIPRPWACRRSQFPTPELLIDLIYVLFGYIFFRAKKITAVQQKNEMFSEHLETFCRLEFIERRIIRVLLLETKRKKKLFSASLIEHFKRTLD